MSGADAWDRIWAPHRKQYLESEAGGYTDETCPFCYALTQPDDLGLIVHRGTHAFVIMNKYPYASGHVLVCASRHVALFDDLTAAETHEVTVLTQQSMRVLRRVARCTGFNIGINQGSVAGAGVAGHLHQHVVPRWAGDSNFMPIVAGTRVMPELIEQTRSLLSAAWQVGD